MKKFPHLWFRKCYCHVHRSLLLDPILSQLIQSSHHMLFPSAFRLYCSMFPSDFQMNTQNATYEVTIRLHAYNHECLNMLTVFCWTIDTCKSSNTFSKLTVFIICIRLWCLLFREMNTEICDVRLFTSTHYGCKHLNIWHHDKTNIFITRTWIKYLKRINTAYTCNCCLFLLVFLSRPSEFKYNRLVI